MWYPERFTKVGEFRRGCREGIVGLEAPPRSVEEEGFGAALRRVRLGRGYASRGGG